jgi:hypothetical protein
MRTALAVPALVAFGSALQAQAAPAAAVPCRLAPCVLIVDWGVGKTIADMPPDRKYGGPAEFEAMLRATLQAHGLSAVATVPDSKVSIRVQATYKTRVLCEEMPGTTPDFSCATIGEALANFATTEPGLKVPTSVRMINRCGASSGVMTMKQFGTFAGEMIWYSLEGEKAKASKPMGKC